MPARLIDDRIGTAFDIRPGVNTIGRHAENDVCLPGMAVSRYHCEIRVEDGAWVLEDQGSTYGTYVNGRKVEGTVALNDGDSIVLGITKAAPEGEFRLTFRAGKEGASAAGRVAGAARAARAGIARRKIEAGRWAIEDAGEHLVARMTGVFRRNETDELLQHIRTEVRATPRTVALDLGKVTYMNSYTLASLIELAASQRERGKALRVFGAAGSVLKLLEMPGEASPIEVCRSEDEALRG